MRRALCLASSLALVATLALAPAAGAYSIRGECEGIMLSQGTLELPPGYWEEGTHTYSLKFTQVGYPDDVWGPFEFTVSRDAPLYPGQVWLAYFVRMAGDVEVPDQAINPAQDSVFWSAWVFDMTGEIFGPPATTMQEAKAALAAATISFSWDGGDWMVARQGPITSACANGFWTGQGSALFHRTFGPNR